VAAIIWSSPATIGNLKIIREEVDQQ